MRLDTALAPLKPAGASRSTLLLAAAFGGALLGIGLALWLELTHRRVRSAADIVQVLDLPVLGRVSGRPAREQRSDSPLLSGRTPSLALGYGRSA